MELNPFKIMVNNYRGWDWYGFIIHFPSFSIVYHHLSPIFHHFPIIFPSFSHHFPMIHHPCSHHFSPDFHRISIESMVESRLFRPTPADALPPQGRGLGQRKKWWKGETRTGEVGGWLGGCYVFVQYCKSKCLTVWLFLFDYLAKCFVEVVVIMFGLDEGRFCWGCFGCYGC